MSEGPSVRPPPACYLRAAVAVLADPDLNLATVIKCETARVRGATVVVPPARSTLAVTNTCASRIPNALAASRIEATLRDA